MSRRLIIGILVVLILGVVGGTIALIIQRFRPTTPDTGETTSPTLSTADQGPQQVANPTGDTDSDGLPNADEVVWGTNPNKADTDGDGFSDGAEVTNSHNPTIAGPNDKLPADFKVGISQQPAATPVPIDSFFAANLNLDPNKNRNLTNEYNQQYSEADRTPDTLNTFINTQQIVTSLPTPKAELTKLQKTDTPLVLGEYLEVAGDFSTLNNRNQIGSAINQLYSNANNGEIMALAHGVRLHQAALAEQRVPPIAQNLHRLLLGYTELLATTYEHMGVFSEDPVKSTLALRQLEVVSNQYGLLIEAENSRLGAIHEQLISHL